MDPFSETKTGIKEMGMLCSIAFRFFSVLLFQIPSGSKIDKFFSFSKETANAFIPVILHDSSTFPYTYDNIFFLAFLPLSVKIYFFRRSIFQRFAIKVVMVFCFESYENWDHYCGKFNEGTMGRFYLLGILLALLDSVKSRILMTLDKIAEKRDGIGRNSSFYMTFRS